MSDLFDRSVHPLYAVMAFISALIVVMVLISGLQNRSGIKRNHKMIFYWVIFFCVQDGIWGMFASHIIHNDMGLFITSEIFHLSAAFSAFAWTRYFLSRITDNTRHHKTYITFAGIVLAIQVAMIIANNFSTFMFYVDENGWYQTTDYRSILFYLQFATYILVGIISFIGTRREDNSGNNNKLMAIFFVNLSPLLFSVFQLIYPDAPADSVGFSISCIIIELFLSKEYIEQVYSLEQMQEKLNAALDEAESANRAKTSFLFNMSHDIRTPMNAIIGFTNIAEKHLDDRERVKDSLSKIKTSGSQLLNLINEVLEMSRIESGKIEIMEEPGDIIGVLDEITPMLQDTAVRKSIEYKVEYGDIPDRYVWVDTIHLTRVLTNIISNAIKYTPNGGKVRVSVNQLESTPEGKTEYCFTVKDTGIGISKEFREHLFTEFTREKTSTVSKQEGTGLGLSIAKRIMELMGGTIEVDSEVGKGSTFTLTVPLRVMTEEEIARNSEEKEEHVAETETTTRILQGKKVLLVEDNELNREIACDILGDLGMDITEAEDGTFAVDIIKEMCSKGIKEEYFDFILMDIQMPTMNGYDATVAIRALDDPYDTHIPIIAMTANAFAEDKQKAIESGMDAHIVKPIDVGILIKTLADFAE